MKAEQEAKPEADEKEKPAGDRTGLGEKDNTSLYKNNNQLRPYQETGVLWLAQNYMQLRSCILADEMGLGKTIQVVALLQLLHTGRIGGMFNRDGPVLIVVPLSTMVHWQRTVQNWTDMSLCVYHDPDDGGVGSVNRSVIREYCWFYKGLSRSMKKTKFDILLTTYEVLLKDVQWFLELSWSIIVADEAHRLRNRRSKILSRLQDIPVQWRLMLTGTPLQNNLGELWTLLQFADPMRFHSEADFNYRFGNLKSPEQVANLQEELKPYVLRRVKEVVTKEIPKKEETIIDVELTLLQKQYYRAIFEHNRDFLCQGKRKSRGMLNNISMQLRKCCNHPYLLDGVEEKVVSAEDITGSDAIINALVRSSGKLILVDKLLPKLKREGHQVSMLCCAK